MFLSPWFVTGEKIPPLCGFAAFGSGEPSPSCCACSDICYWEKEEGLGKKVLCDLEPFGKGGRFVVVLHVR